jgi:hypothetical protein
MAASAMEGAQEWADNVDATSDKLAEESDGLLAGLKNKTNRMGMVRTARLIGGAMVTILLIAVVLNEVFNAVNVGSGPFSEIGNDLETTGVAAVSLLVVGLIVVAANRLMNIFGSGM